MIPNELNNQPQRKQIRDAILVLLVLGLTNLLITMNGCIDTIPTLLADRDKLGIETVGLAAMSFIIFNAVFGVILICFSTGKIKTLHRLTIPKSDRTYMLCYTSIIVNMLPLLLFLVLAMITVFML